ncbi:MAG: glycosyltransferase [Candidatus Helarchaeota archaeon]
MNSNKRILFPVIGRFPSGKAKTIQIIHTASWIANSNALITLVFPKRKIDKIRSNNPKIFMKFYNIKKLPKIVKLPSVEFSNNRFKNIAWYAHIISYLISFSLYLFKVIKKGYNYLLIRDWHLLYLLVFLKKIFRMKVIFEMHRIPKGTIIIKKFCLLKVNGVITISKNLKNFLIKNRIYKKVIVIPDAFEDIKVEDHKDILLKIREKLNLKPNSEIIIYTGHLYKERNVELLIEAMKYIKNKRIVLLIIGGIKKDIRRLKNLVDKYNLNNVIFIGFVPPYLVPYYLKLAKVGIITVSYESPLKLFEYMGSNLPIITVDSPSIREIIINNYNGIIVPDNNPQKLAEKIEFIIDNPEFAKKISFNAYKIAISKYTYKVRARNILKFIDSI